MQLEGRVQIVPGGIRTPNLLIRSQKLYPVELQALLTAKKWGGRRDSNPQQPEPQSGALPLSYGHHHWRENKILKFESFFANKGLDFSRSFH
jgi:hypothetical protein